MEAGLAELAVASMKEGVDDVESEEEEEDEEEEEVDVVDDESVG